MVEMTSSSKPSPFILKQKEKLQKEIEELLGTDGVLLYPTHPHLAPKHHHPLFTPFNFAYTGERVWKTMSNNTNGEIYEPNLNIT